MGKKWLCVVCGYIHEGDTPPDECPICGVSADGFELYEDNKKGEKKDNKVINKWICLVCGYIHDGETPPDECPICSVSADEFEPYEDETENGDKTEKTEKKEIKDETYIIIGGGIAGLSAIKEIRSKDKDIKIVLISKEDKVPYYRINLSRYLADEIGKDELIIESEGWYKENNIELILGEEVISIDKGEKTVILSDQKELKYDKLLLSSGAHPFIPPIKGVKLDGVFSIRTIKDVEKVLEKSKGLKHCVAIGGGILGIEIASAIAKKGIKVTLLEGAKWLMPRQLNQNGSNILLKHLNSIGIEVLMDVKVDQIYGDEKVKGVKINEDGDIKTEMVLITTGIRPNTHLAIQSGIKVDKGVVVNSYLETSDPNIYSAGDIAEHKGILYGLWNAAMFQGKIAGSNMLGDKIEFGGIPRSNILKVLDIDLFSIGQFMAIDGSYTSFEKIENDRYYLFMLRDGAIVGSIVIGDKILSAKVKKVIESVVYLSKSIFDTFDKIYNFVENY